MSKYIIGSIARPVGLKGEVIINPDTYDINRYFELDAVYAGRSEETSTILSIESVRIHKGRPVIKFESIDSRSDAENIVDYVLFIDEKDRVELPEGIYFIHDIIGMHVYSIDEEFIGIVKDVLTLPAQNIYIVHHNNKEVMIPAVDEFIESIDNEDKIIRIKPIEGLLE